MKGYRGPNSVQRRNDAMFAMFERAEKSGHNSLHPQTKKEVAHNKKEYEIKHNSKGRALSKMSK